MHRQGVINCVVTQFSCFCVVFAPRSSKQTLGGLAAHWDSLARDYAAGRLGLHVIHRCLQSACRCTGSIKPSNRCDVMAFILSIRCFRFDKYIFNRIVMHFKSLLNAFYGFCVFVQILLLYGLGMNMSLHMQKTNAFFNKRHIEFISNSLIQYILTK